MTNRSSTKKVLKNTPKPRNRGIAGEVIKHFEHRKSSVSGPTDLNAEIPEIDTNIDEQVDSETAVKHIFVSRNQRNISRPKVGSSFPIAKHPIVPQKDKQSVESRSENKNPKRHLRVPITTSSSSSVESNIEKFNTNCRARSKSFQGSRNNTRKSCQNQNSTKKNVRSISTPTSRSGSLKSRTDPLLLQKEMNLKSLKNEILENKQKNGSCNAQNKMFPCNGEGVQVQSLRREILQTKNKNIMHRKVLITELKTEIAQYKRFNNFQVYNLHNSQDSNNSQTKQNMCCPKNIDTNVSLCNNFRRENNLVQRKGCSNRVKIRRDDYGGEKSESRGWSKSEPESTENGSVKGPSKDLSYSDTESLDDEVIKTKIQEANILIDRVKKALGKIKTIKTATEGTDEHGKDDYVEDTIRSLKMDTEQLIIGFTNETVTEQELPKEDTEKINTCSEEQLGEKDKFPKDQSDLEQKQDELYDRREEIDDGNLREMVEQSCKFLETEDLERPKTRRSETEDDLTDQLRLDKFRTCSDDGKIEISSSIEALQAKLQTISESTESNFSTPRYITTKGADSEENIIKVPPVRKELKSCGCNTDRPKIETKGVQVKPKIKCVAVQNYSPTRENVGVQVSPPSKILTPTCLQVESVSPKCRNLDAEKIAIQQIAPVRKAKCQRCQENLPIEEILPPREIRHCKKCQKKLKEEHMPVFCIEPKETKLQKLHIQVMPQVNIPSKMTLRQILNFEITPDGKTYNLIENSPNAVFIQVKTPQEKAQLKKACQQIMTHTPKRRMNDAYSHSESELFIKMEKDRDNVLRGLKSKASIDFRDQNDEKERKFIYKSYQLYDNPNFHDPGHLDIKSRDKISVIDMAFYRTFINPDGPDNTTDTDISRSSLHMDKTRKTTSRNKLAGFESKTVQCTESVLIAEQELNPPTEEMKPSESRKIEFKLADHSESFDPLETMAIEPTQESQITIEKLQSQQQNTTASMMPLTSASRGFRDPKSKSSFKMPTTLEVKKKEVVGSTTPSEITLTISYSESDEFQRTSSNVINGETENNFRTDGKNKSTEMEKHTRAGSSAIEKEPKILTVKDKDTIEKIKKKLETVDTNASAPVLTIKQTSETIKTVDTFIRGLTRISIGNNEAEEGTSEHSKEKVSSPDPDIHFCHVDHNVPTELNMYLKHLEVAQNGRYKDEENLFCENLYPTQPHRQGPVGQKHAEVSINKLEFFPKRMLRNFSPDTSNSDTVTTGTLSDGEVQCKHSVSNGEIHFCKKPRKTSVLRSNVLTQKNFYADPKVTIEQRRNYFNNWVTYYVRTQEINDSSTSSSNNK